MGLFAWLGIYVLLALVTIVSTNRASHYVNELDKKTQISGALLGGVMLAVVTSLPEFITSITSTVFLDQPGLAFGNVFGSNMFNLTILAVVDLIFIKHLFFNKTRIGVKTNSLIIMMYAIFLAPWVLSRFNTALGYDALDIRIGLTFNVISLLIILVYFLTLKSMNDELPQEKDATRTSDLTKRRIMLMFVFWSLFVIASSAAITYVTDELSVRMNLTASFAGAIFLGAATSLPELTAVITLFKLKNYDVALGNILGSNIFNMTIISVVDIINARDNIFEELTFDAELGENVVYLLILGLINSIILLIALKRKTVRRKIWYAIPSIVIILGYLVYVALSL